eukprot:c1755_g1_i1.p1 GENE.c1755_g1_i1~~c1755_g1_i1.p1  ORF type:complete len:342 (+),score=37.19 c1755_g1_i1:283-1308(+)
MRSESESSLDIGTLCKPFNVIFENQSSEPVGLLVHMKSIHHPNWKTEGWFRLEPGEKGLTGTSETPVFFYYAENLGQRPGLDRRPRGERTGWWGEADPKNNFTDLVMGFRKFEVGISCSNIVISLDLQSRSKSVVSDDEDDPKENGVHTQETEHYDRSGSNCSATSSVQEERDTIRIEASEFEQMVKKAKIVAGHIESQTLGLLGNLIQLRSSTSNAIHELHLFFDDQQRALERRRTELLSQLMTESQAKCSVLTAALSSLDATRSSLNQSLTQAETITSTKMDVGEALQRRQILQLLADSIQLYNRVSPSTHLDCTIAFTSTSFSLAQLGSVRTHRLTPR